MCHVLAKEESIFGGGSSGANAFGAINLSRVVPDGSNIVTLCPDSGLK